MIALIATNLAWATLVAFLVSRGLAFHRQHLALADARESAKDQNHREHIKHLEGQIVLLKVAPQQAAALVFPDPDPGAYIGPFDDEALAEMEIERSKVQ